MTNRLTKRELAQSLHAAGRTTEQIAVALEAPEGLVLTWLGVPQSPSAELTLADRRAFLMLPMDVRRRILAEQAERVMDVYEATCQAVQEAVKMGEAGL